MPATPTPKSNPLSDEARDAAAGASPKSPRPRRRRGWIWALTTVVVLAAAALIWGPSVYRAAFVAPAAENPIDELQTESTGQPSPMTAGQWSVSSGSYAGYRLDEVLRGENVTVTARTSQVTGTATTTSTQLTAAQISADVGSIASDADGRDRYFRTQAVDVSQHPTATFTLTQPVDLTDEAGAARTSVQLQGDLEINGVRQAVTVDAAVATEGAGVRVAGQIPITFADFGVEAPSLGFVAVEDHGFVEFSTVLSRVG
ncbi:YceI family protein [Pseudoclavibacter sp. 13-3]|uniref:YceI family protein n=1 Tax=Pseudoclavibacter sp. 13-3 TaxID=2901228 RepID=UPI001E5068F6|nr:YceI family protein [Pseudoclavibacter sp. 13-3]MCD7101440.1 YceI family protein [Pseudoclavibacter sp. 13-3]